MTIRQTLAQWFYSPGAYGLWLALDDVENWNINSRENEAFYVRGCKRSGDPYEPKYLVCMRASNAWKFDGSRATPPFLGRFERHFLWRKYKTMNNRRMLFVLTRLEDPK